MDYFEHRHTGKGFGTLGLARQGYSVEARPRHTALAGWLLGSVLREEALNDPNLRALFRTGALALLGGDPVATAEEFAVDRNPLLLYLAAWHVGRQVESQEWEVYFSKEERNRMKSTWASSKDALLQRSLKRTYTRGLPQHLAEGRVLFPMTVPYGEFVRMESYSLLSAATLAAPEMPQDILARIRDGILALVRDYLYTCEFGRPEVRYSRNPLQPRHRGARPHLARDKSGHPDLGCTAMLVRVLRSPRISKVLWTGLSNETMQELTKARYFLVEDLAELFDRYLIDPGLYALSHAGMLAALLDGDHPGVRLQVIDRCRRILEHLPSTELNDNTLDDVLSERRLYNLVEEIVEDDGLSERTQLSTISLTRLLLDKLRPGRYVADKLSPKGVRDVSVRTISVYRQPEFVEKYIECWGNKPDLAIVAPFIQMIRRPSKILDVGCGPGQYAVQFSKAGHQVALLDCSQPFLQSTSERLASEGYEPLSTFNCNVLDQASLGRVWKEGPYDAIWCAGLFAHVPASARPQLLGWFRELLKPDGVLFVNLMLENPRLFARDSRFYVYDANSRDFLSVLSQAGFQSDYVVRRTVRRNTYGEPLLETYWANYYAFQARNEVLSPHVSTETFLTALAYERSIEDWRHIYGEKDRSCRLKYVHEVLDRIATKTKMAKPRVLDAGCGFGDHVIEAAKRGWEAVGIDISERMIQSARESCPARLKPLPSFYVGDIRHLPAVVTSRLFDAVICVTALQHIPEREISEVLSEFARALRPLGIVRVDLRIGENEGYDPDLRFIQSFPDSESVISMAKTVGLVFLEAHPFETIPGMNTFKRPLGFKFIELWFVKQ